MTEKDTLERARNMVALLENVPPMDCATLITDHALEVARAYIAQARLLGIAGEEIAALRAKVEKLVEAGDAMYCNSESDDQRMAWATAAKESAE